MATCKTCSDPLTLTLDPEDSGDESSSAPQQTEVPDDLLLPCSCHFHWQCLLDQSPQIAISLACPSCNTYLPQNTPGGASSTNPFRPVSQQNPIFTTYTNEGGVQEDLDILPILTEEAFLVANPSARPARAMHTLASEGDVQGMLELLADVDADEAIDMSMIQLLTWTDPLNGGKSALHVALEAKQEDVFWLLLWLASGVHESTFPEAVTQTAQALGLPRRTVPPGEDIRFVKDEGGKTVADLCLELGVPWKNYVEMGLFN